MVVQKYGVLIVQYEGTWKVVKARRERARVQGINDTLKKLQVLVPKEKPGIEYLIYSECDFTIAIIPQMVI